MIPIQPLDDSRGASSGSDDWIWARDRLGELHLIAGEPFSPGMHSTVGQAIDAGLLALALGLAWILFHEGVPALMRPLPLRMKLFGIFLNLTGIGFVGLAALGFSHFQERKEVLIAQAHRAGVELPTRIDQGMAAEKTKLLRVFRDFMADPDFRKDQSKMRNKANSLEWKAIANWFEDRDLQGELVFITELPNLTQEIGAIGRVMSRRYIDIFLEDRLPLDRRFSLELAELIIFSFFFGLICDHLRSSAAKNS